MLALVDASRSARGAASIRRLLRQLSDLGVAADTVDNVDALRCAMQGATCDVVVIAGDIVLHDRALRSFVTATGSRALVSRREQVGATAARIDRDRILSAGSAYHRVTGANAWSLDVVAVAPADCAIVADTLAGVPGESDTGGLAPLLTVAAVRTGLPVRAFDIRELLWRRAADDGAAVAAQAELDAADEETLAMHSAVKAEDEAFTTFLVSPYSRYVARWCARRGIRPNAVTIVSILLGAGAAATFALGTRAGLITGAVLLLASFVLDCVDGQLARLTATFSSFGAWLDITFDRAKEYAVYAGLAVGAGRAGLGNFWPWALAALVIRVSRHLVDFSFAARTTLGRTVSRSLAEPTDGLPDVASGGAVARTSARMDASSALRWLRKIAVLPFGQRMALIAVTTAVSDARITFYALVPWAGAAGLYSTTGRVLRSLSR